MKLTDEIRSARAGEAEVAQVSGQGVALTAPLPADVPEPPPTDATVRWPAGTGPPPPVRGDDDVLDLGAVGVAALLRRAVPVAAAALVLTLAAAALKRRRRG